MILSTSGNFFYMKELQGQDQVNREARGMDFGALEARICQSKSDVVHHLLMMKMWLFSHCYRCLS